MSSRSAMTLALALGLARLLHPGPPPHAVGARWAPDAPTLRWISLGHPTVAATALWMSTVARWSTASPPDPSQAASLHRAVLTIGELDPGWAAPWFYGSLMLGALDRVDLHESLLRRATELYPLEPWFPVALEASGMLHQPDGRAPWLDWAASQPPTGVPTSPGGEEL